MVKDLIRSRNDDEGQTAVYVRIGDSVSRHTIPHRSSALQGDVDHQPLTASTAAPQCPAGGGQ